MNAQSIGESAKAIWHLLHGDNRKWEYQELKKATGLRDRELNAAIGWHVKEKSSSTKVCKDKILHCISN